MMWFLFLAARAATIEPVDVDAISANVDVCLAAVRAEFDGGAVLPTRATAAATNAELCSKEPALATMPLVCARDAAVEVYRAARARLDADVAAKARQRPALSGRVTVEDEWITSSLDRARASQVQEPESPDAALALGAWTEVERLNAQIGVLDASAKRVGVATRQYLALRDALWLADCTGEIDLAYPEDMPNDPRYSREEQCRQLTQRRTGVHSTEVTTGNPGGPRF